MRNKYYVYLIQLLDCKNQDRLKFLLSFQYFFKIINYGLKYNI